MNIHLMRHGIAGPAPSDSERQLTETGREQVRQVFIAAKPALEGNGLILSSPLRRAVETAEIARETLGWTGEILKSPALLPEASPIELWNDLRGRREEKRVLLIGHQPLIGRAAAFLSASPTLHVIVAEATLVRIDIDFFGPQPRGELKWVLTPALAQPLEVLENPGLDS